MEDILLVDEDDNIIGKEEKLSAHKSGKLHRAFSVFVFNSKKELLIQKRAQGKYHSAGLWSNTCCSHPVTEDTIKEVMNYKWVAPEKLHEDIKKNPGSYTHWLKLCLSRVISFS